MATAQSQLESMLRSANMTVVSEHQLSDFVNADPKLLKFDEIQSEIEQTVQDELRTNNYGIQIEFLGLKRIELPESVTEAVFNRMKAERQVLISQADNLGKAEAIMIKANADRQANETLANAQAASHADRRRRRGGSRQDAAHLPAESRSGGLHAAHRGAARRRSTRRRP